MASAIRTYLVYVLGCRDGTLYTGTTNDLAGRMRAHLRGSGSRYVRSRAPFALCAWWETPSRGAALREEARFRKLTRAEKLAALAAGQVFGRNVRNAPHVEALHERSIPANGGTMATHVAPSGDELATLTTEAANVQARIRTAKGEIVFRFFPDDAPRHCAAFIKLARSGFYDGLKFHRVVPGFVIQGGCPLGSGTGGPGYNLAAEFSARPHRKGTVAMARSSQPDSAGSQFYICLEDAPFLDRQYTVFGQVSSGQSVVDAIRVGDVMQSVAIEPVSPEAA